MKDYQTLIGLLAIALAIYLGLWILNLLVEITERLFLKFGKRILTVEK